MENNKNIICATSRREDGNMGSKYGEINEVIHNRKTFLEKHGLRLEDSVKMKVEHGEKITIVDSTNKISVQNPHLLTEALITKEKNLTLFLTTGDCLPVALYDTDKQVIALAHLGWRPTNNKLAVKVIEKMKNEFSSDPSNIIVHIGPGIHKESYVFENPIQKNLHEWQPFLTDTPNGETLIDLVGYNKHQLLNAGIKEENIFIDSTNTAISDKYFSHYRSIKTGELEGRFATILAMI